MVTAPWMTKPFLSEGEAVTAGAALALAGRQDVTETTPGRFNGGFEGLDADIMPPPVNERKI